MKSPITTHVLDTANGNPAKGVPVTLSIRDGDGEWKELTRGVTNDDGRITDWLPEGERAQVGVYKATFRVGSYYKSYGDKPFYSEIPVIFHLHDPASHYHVPLLLSPYGYTTYRGS